MASNKCCSILVHTKMVLMLVMVLMVFASILVNVISSSPSSTKWYGPNCYNQAEQYNVGSCSVINSPILVNAMSSSYMTVWEGPGCNNKAERYNVCGCSAINQHGGYEFVFGGESAALYDQPGCTGRSHFRFHAHASGCQPIGWLSIFIQC